LKDHENIDVIIDLDMLVERIIRDKAALRKIAEALRTAQTKQSRQMGNLYGRTAEQPRPAPSSRTRLQ